MNTTKETPEVVSNNQLAIERTEFALERTHLAWVRTCITLITAGIAIDKVFAILHEARTETGVAWVNNAHIVGLTMVISGMLLLLMITIYYLKRMTALRQLRGLKRQLFAPGFILSVIIFLIGALLVFMVISTPLQK